LTTVKSRSSSLCDLRAKEMFAVPGPPCRKSITGLLVSRDLNEIH